MGDTDGNPTPAAGDRQAPDAAPVESAAFCRSPDTGPVFAELLPLVMYGDGCRHVL
ncbi:hypothetical protein FRAHR75_40016 [Frankia sp. Hr75.2]|nr:hypothetical protein FRAHR75_40016 [Frankia sp. Hr75.2]